MCGRKYIKYINLVDINFLIIYTYDIPITFLKRVIDVEVKSL